MKRVALSEVKADLSRYLRLAANEELVITRHGRVAGVLIGFESEDDWSDYCLENDPRFLNRVAGARVSLRAGRGMRLEDVGATSNGGGSANGGRRRVRTNRAHSRSGRGR